MQLVSKLKSFVWAGSGIAGKHDAIPGKAEGGNTADRDPGPAVWGLGDAACQKGFGLARAEAKRNEV